MQATPEQVLFRKFEAEGAASAFANEAGQLQRVRKLPSGYSMRRRAALEVAKKPLLGLSERSLGARVSFFVYEFDMQYAEMYCLVYNMYTSFILR